MLSRLVFCIICLAGTINCYTIDRVVDPESDIAGTSLGESADRLEARAEALYREADRLEAAGEMEAARALREEAALLMSDVNIIREGQKRLEVVSVDLVETREAVADRARENAELKAEVGQAEYRGFRAVFDWALSFGWMLIVFVVAVCVLLLLLKVNGAGIRGAAGGAVDFIRGLLGRAGPGS